ncbi:Hypothetical protein NTJ_10427 [Nesidiocoris tenuis]|uniref:Uncharacterized protein n=1 Tax=Nesidiocoris tenuis TaxID=355587 RepID=A0ABN7B061_9HEMI|nr:Hypothetical protein NTJ_10427 [Nesidiocoris tenuis]
MRDVRKTPEVHGNICMITDFHDWQLQNHFQQEKPSNFTLLFFKTRKNYPLRHSSSKISDLLDQQCHLQLHCPQIKLHIAFMKTEPFHERDEKKLYNNELFSRKRTKLFMRWITMMAAIPMGPFSGEHHDENL